MLASAFMNYPKDMMAQMLVVGFVKGWDLRTVVEATTKKRHVLVDTSWPTEIHQACPFMPDTQFDYVQQASSYICNQYPKLGAYLMGHLGEPEKLAKVTPQVEKLIFKRKEKRSIHAKEDVSEHGKVLRARKMSKAGNAAIRSAYESNLRGAWNVCKG